ncbi:hypothetical protein PT974_07803 [Cladobotryum mycophilum]|uniref:N-acetyltransferase B complex non catalytic subunit n=1 Tax=Cladobotryum mycophilum TaxID=491253 RepID=A0ABR0SHX5_9HYPO
MNRQGPRLKNGVDLQLQNAFSDGNWPVAIRLAEKRAKTLNDQYYEVVKVCAESQLDDPTAKFAAVAVVWQYVKDGTVVKDVDAIDLLEWATQNLLHEDDFPQTIGPLRVRAAKASPKDKNGVTRCLESCLLHWDLVSAQQIAAIVDRSFPGERDFLFWNIVITHMLSLSSQSPPEKKKLYGTLAQKQIERAAQATEQAESSQDGPKAPARRVQTEEEILLLYDVVESHGTADDFGKLISSSVFSPVSQFRRGRKEVLQRAVAKYSRDGNWAIVFTLCKECLSETDGEGQPTLLASDFLIWKHFISAASHLKDADQKATEDVRELLAKLLASKNMRPMYRRNILLARVSAAFELGPSDEEDAIDGQPTSLRLRELIYYIKDQSTSAACFNDVKGFLERLDVGGLKYLAFEHLPQLSSGDANDVNTARINLLSLKTKYFTLTRRLKSTNIQSEPGPRCAVCESKVDASICRACLSRLSKAAVESYSSHKSSEGSAIATEIVPELGILISFCSLNQAFGSQQYGDVSPSARRHLLRAVLLLEDQLTKNPTHGQISLILVQLHLFLGSVYRASEIWEAVGVKRTIVDSLAPIFYDRLSSVSPSLLSPTDDWGSYLIGLLKSHYNASLKLKMPRRLVDSFEAGSYSSVMGIPHYIENLRASSTRVMSLTEGRRAERLLGLSGDFMSDPRYYEVNDDVSLVQVVDYGSFPSWGSATSQALHLRLGLGPDLSNRRSHLSLLSETFHDLLSYKPPPIYKVSASSDAEQIFVIEMMSRLSNSFANFLVGPDGEFTSSELVYFEALSLLSTLITLCVGIDRSAPLPGLDQLMDAVKAALETLQAKVSGQKSGIEHTVALLGSMHNVSLLRDMAVAAKSSAQWLLGFNERERERDRSGKSCLPKELVTQIKGLQAAADLAIKDGQGLITRLKGEVVSRDFDANLKRWILDAKEDGDDEVVSVLTLGLISEVVESWQANVKGWGQVKW